MGDSVLKFVIDATLKGSGFKDAGASLGDLQKKAQESDTAFEEAAQGAEGLGEAIKQSATEATSAYNEQEAVQNRLAKSMLDMEQATSTLAQAQAELEANTDPEKQLELASNVADARVALDGEKQKVDELKGKLSELSANTSKASQSQGFLQKTTQELNQGMSGAIQGLTGMSVSSFGVVGAVTALAGGLKYAIDQAAEAERGMAQTEAVIRSTGGAAGLTAQEIADMAGALSQSSTFSDDAVQKGQNLLLTFTGIGREVFPMATQAMLDMATAMGTDASSGAIQLGKALNDPTAGIAALSRVGVVFTSEQKNLIKSLQDTGDMAGAQKVILAELNKEFGGSAAAAVDTYSGQLTLLKNNFDNLAEAVGGEFIPVLAEAAGTLNLLMTWTDKVNAKLEEHSGEVVHTAQTYEEYIAELERAAKVAGYEVNAEGQLVSVIRGRGMQTETVIDATYQLTEAEYAQIQATDATTLAWSRFSDTNTYVTAGLEAGKQSVEAWSQSQKDAALAADALKQSEQDLATIIGGTLGPAQEEFHEKQVTAWGDIQTTQAAIDVLNGKQYLTPAQQTELETLKGTLEDQKQVYADNATAHEEATARIVFGFIQQRMAADGLQEGEIAALGEIGLAWGIYDQTTADALAAVDGAITEHGTNAQAIIDALHGSIEDLPDTTNIAINVNTNYTSSGSPSPAAGEVGIGPSGGTGIPGTDINDEPPGPGGAQGMDFIVPPGYPNDSFPIRVQSGEHVVVTPSGEGGGMGGGGFINYGNITITAAPGESAKALWGRLKVEAARDARSAVSAGAKVAGI